MTTSLRTILFACALSGCCFGGTAATSPTATAPSAPMAAGVPYTVAPGVPVWSDSYAVRYLSDGTNTSYWCTSSGPTLPIVATLGLAAPSAITGVDFDTRVPGYESSAINLVTVETLGSGGLPLDTQTISLVQNDVTSLSFAVPLTATEVRLTFHSTFGGSYAALAEVTLRSGIGMGRPAVAAIAPTLGARPAGAGIPYSVAPSLPFWNDTYSPARMQDATPSSYWCTPMNPTFPFTGTFALAMPSVVSGVMFDNRLPGYDTSGIQGVTITAYGPAGDVLTTTAAMLPQAAATLVPMPMPITASRIDVTFASNHGGPYAGLTELVIQ